jgi:muramoyltetrapeptide carboxypeptidase
MPIRFPAPLQPGDRVAVTSPSSGVPERYRERLDFAIETVRNRGYEVIVGECMDGASHVSAPAADRAAELTAMLTDPLIRAVVPPWGGETAIDLLPLLDFDAIASADPTWLVGFSDMSTLLTAITVVTGIATLHGNNLMDTPYQPPDQLLTWLDIAALPAGATFTQSSPGKYRAADWDDWTASPRVTEHAWNGAGTWTRLDAKGAVDVTGRLIGGCIETIRHLAGTPYGDLARLGRDRDHRDRDQHDRDRRDRDQHDPNREGLIVYVEAGGDDAFSICRSLHGMRLAGSFEEAEAVLVARTIAPDCDTLSQHEAVLDALGVLGVPIVADVECGHVPPYLPIVNGALGHLRCTADDRTLIQTLS